VKAGLCCTELRFQKIETKASGERVCHTIINALSMFVKCNKP
jgi:hypothetical protein